MFYSPKDLVYNLASFKPLRLVLAGMKEVTRTFKVLTGINQAHRKYKDALMVMIAVGWARGQCWRRVPEIPQFFFLCVCVRLRETF